MSVGCATANEYKKIEREREREREKRERKTNLYSGEKERKRGPRHQWLIVRRQSCTYMPLIPTNDDIPQRND